jgi:hypothetical protein
MELGITAIVIAGMAAMVTLTAIAWRDRPKR